MNIQIITGSFIGSLLNALCFGVLTIQTSSYYRAFPSDGRPVKLVVAILWTLEAFQLASLTHSVYWVLVTNHNNGRANVTWDFSTFQISAVCASVTVQTFFSHRVYSLSANIYLGALVEILVLAQFGFGVATAVGSYPLLNTVSKFKVVVKKWTWLPVSWVAMQAIADVMIATCMCLLLRRRRTGFQKTDSVINRMVLYTISTGLVTSVLSCILLALFAEYSLDFSVFAICMPLGGFYSVTMLANLHTRKRLRERLDTPSPLELISTTIKKRLRQNRGDHGNEERLQAGRINIATEVV